VKLWRIRSAVLAAGLMATACEARLCAQTAVSGNIAQADAALQDGQADRALKMLASLPQSGAGAAEVHNLTCRVRMTLEQWDAAATECEKATQLDANNSNDHLWLGRALGQKASKAAFLTAFSLAKRSRAEFEEAVRLDGGNGPALSDLGDFYRQAPGVVGGGIDKAQQIAQQLDKVDPARAHQLRAQIAEQQKDYDAEEGELKQAIPLSAHPALAWSTLANFYAHRQRFTDMEAAIRSDRAAAMHDPHAAVGLYDGAGLLIETKRDFALAAIMLEDYLASAGKTEEAPAFIAHLRLAQLKQQAGDAAGAEREREAALALAPEYRPAQNSRPRTALQPNPLLEQAGF
jgi:tetratricopeptide (TPR) repeat protein